jgi:ribosome-binding factor A
MKYTPTSTGKSVRTLRVGEEIRHILAEVFTRHEVHDPILQSAIITVSDLRHATVFVEPLGGVDEAGVLLALKQHAPYLKGILGQRLRTKYTPQLKFLIDESFAQSAKIQALLRSPKVKRDLL